MSFWQFLNHWWNLPYLVMLGLVAVFFALQLFGFATHDGDAEHELDHDADVDHELDHEVDHDAEHDVDQDHDSPGVAEGVLAFLGVGRVPFLVVWMTLFIFSGFSGLFLNRVLFVKLGESLPGWTFPLSLLASLAIGAFATRATAGQVGKLVDVGGRGSVRRRELQGQFGVIASASCDAEFGEVRVRDERGHEHLVHGHVPAGERPLLQGDKVLIIEFDKQSELYLVEKCEPGSSGRAKE